MRRGFHIISATGHVAGGYRERSDAEYDMTMISVDAPEFGRMEIVEANGIEDAEAMIPKVFATA